MNQRSAHVDHLKDVEVELASPGHVREHIFTADLKIE